uniref:Xeroderma pigmentosum, complementation group C n=1 Tax=Myripristis murdjan TaxID=586833 RepID=A0A667WLI7_9TELE
MAKRKESAETEADTKKLRQGAKAKSRAARPRARREPGNGIAEEEEKLERKVKPKVRSSSKPAGVPAALVSSKYFHSPVKEEEESDDDDFDDFDLVTTPPPAVKAEAVKKTVKEEEEDEDESEEDDWEEVEELAEPLGPVEPPEPVLPSQPVEIEIETPDIMHKRQRREKRKAEFEAYLRRMVNRFNKDLLMDTHKVHLMCLIANGMFRNRVCSEPDLLAVTLSLLPVHFTKVAKGRIDQNYLSGLLKWFGATFTLNPSLPCEERPDLRALLERRLASLSAKNHQEMTHLFLLVLRSLQLFCRLVLSLQPVSLKLPPAKKAKKKEVKEEDEEEEVEKSAKAGGQKPKNAKRRSVASKVSYKEESNSEGDEEEAGGLSEEEFQASGEEESEDSEGGAKSRRGKNGKGKSKAKTSSKNGSNTAPKRRSGGGKKKAKNDEEEDEDKGTKRRSGRKRDGPGADEWLEVYLDKSSCWVCVDVEHGVGLPLLCSQNATAPVTYVVSVDGDGFLKDLGRKYDPTWMTSSRKRRVDDDWWEETLEPFLGPEDERDMKEDKELHAKLLDKPLPTSIAEYKNHPLYALTRHLLKYEALYPATAAVLGYCRGEPVYSRDCVHTLHSRDTWLKEARTVRLGEEPYKMVRGFSNRSRKARMMSEQKDEKDLPLFGEWQTEEYQPPVAVDGKVPRNDYGNVYLFKPCMLPVGCVHLRLPNLHRVARKLDLDAAPAVTGFDFHGGYSHAVTDGYIVCEEHEELLRAAWVEEQEVQKQKEKEKQEKRAIANWTLLVKGLLIRERLQRRYGKKNQGPGGLIHTQDREGAGALSSDEEAGEGGGAPGAKTAAETLAMSWPQNRQDEQQEDGKSASGLKKKTTKREKRGQEKHLFPFEKV